MKTLVLGVMLAGMLCGSSSSGEEVVRTFSWSGSAFVQGKEGDNAPMTIEGKSGEPAVVLTIEDPKGVGVGPPAYAFTGEVRCEGVEGNGCVEMWSWFPDGSHFFSRTLASYGPMKSLSGTGGWTQFVVPFFLNDSPRRPVKLVLNVVLPGKGKVELRSLKLVQYRTGEDPLMLPGQWWGGRTGGLVGGSIGGLFGILGGLIGVLAGRGRARGFVVGALWTMGFCGILCAAACVLALAGGQPYAVWYPFALAAVTVLGFAMIPVARRRYAQLELRRMEALDAK